MGSQLFPSCIPNHIAGTDLPAAAEECFEKLDPVTGQPVCRVARSRAADVRRAVEAAREAQPGWANLPPVRRGELLHQVAAAMKNRQEAMSEIVARETGKSRSLARAETDGAVALGLFFAGEGQRLYGRTTTSGTAHRLAMTVRRPVGVAGLIVAANTPIANVAWKVFPALICGNAAVLKAAEDTPITAWYFAKIVQEAGLPDGVLNVVQGYGKEAGAPLVADPDVGVVSFTGSTAVGRVVAVVAGERLAKLSLELGGKNPLVVCEDADLEDAARWVCLSAFSNAGQRCAAGSRIIVFDAIYDRFREMLVERTRKLRVGPAEEDDLGPIINMEQLSCMLAAVERARQSGARILTGGDRLTGPEHRYGFFMAPTLLENVSAKAEISRTELFGPIACLYKVGSFDEALQLANDSPYGLTACIHTMNVHRALQFAQNVQAGVAVVNAGTYGSEPHMPFGGVKLSGNGSREPGTEALDVYSNLMDVYISTDPQRV